MIVTRATKVMRVTLAMLGLMALLGFFFSFALEASFSSRAKLIQIVDRRPDLLRTGGQGYLAVSATEMRVLDDAQAFLPGFGDQGQYLVDAAVLKHRNEYPIEMKSVETMAWIARVGCLLASVACCSGYFLMPSIGRSRER